MKDLANKVSETAHLVIERLTAKLVHSDRVETNELCVGSTCVTAEQFNSVFNSQSAAAGTPATTGVSGAPSGPSASGSPSADEGSITLDDDSNATTTATIHPTAANDNESVVADDTPNATEPEADGATNQPAEPEAQTTEPELGPANDNPPPSSAVAI